MTPRRDRTGKRRAARGSNLIEFTLVGIPLVFMILTIFQISLGMFTYHTLANAIDVGARLASVQPGNVGGPNGIAQTIINNAPGLLPGKLTLTFSGTVGGTATPVATCVATTCVSSYSSTAFPPGSAFTDTLTVLGTYPFATPFAMFWPTVGPMKLAGNITLGATTTQLVQ